MPKGSFQQENGINIAHMQFGRDFEGRARDLTVSWLRWHYSGEILEDHDLGRLLSRAEATGRRYGLIQGYGHVVAEHAGPNGGKASKNF